MGRTHDGLVEPPKLLILLTFFLFSDNLGLAVCPWFHFQEGQVGFKRNKVVQFLLTEVHVDFVGGNAVEPRKRGDASPAECL